MKCIELSAPQYQANITCSDKDQMANIINNAPKAMQDRLTKHKKIIMWIRSK